MSRYAAIEQEAASWLARRQEADWSETNQGELDAWIEASVDHAAAYWRLEYGYAQFDRLRSLPERPRRTIALPFPLSSGRITALAATLTAVALVGGIVMYRDRLTGAAEITTFSTQLGQVAKIELGDGTLVSLDTDSQVRVASDSRERKVLLDRGNVYLEVAHDAARPFVVQADIGRVTVLGTKFAIARESKAIKVSVLSGRVRLDPARRHQGTVSTIGAGEIGETDGDYVSVKGADLEDIAQSLAWREGKIVFDATRLADAAAQFNKYNDHKVLVTDPAAADVRIGGTFRLGNVRGFANLLRDSYGLRVDTAGDNTTISIR